MYIFELMAFFSRPAVIQSTQFFIGKFIYNICDFDEAFFSS